MEAFLQFFLFCRVALPTRFQFASSSSSTQKIYYLSFKSLASDFLYQDFASKVKIHDAFLINSSLNLTHCSTKTIFKSCELKHNFLHRIFAELMCHLQNHTKNQRHFLTSRCQCTKVQSLRTKSCVSDLPAMTKQHASAHYSRE